MPEKISIITVVLNNRQGLVDTVQSVLSQTVQVEYIIIDGGSTDGTVEACQPYQERIACLVSEKDSGVYNAMNKGILKATGDYVLFLNAGDLFEGPNALKTLVSQSSGEDIIYGDLIVRSPVKEYIQRSPDQPDFAFFVEDTLPHPAALIRRSLFSEGKMYNEDMKICADWAFFLDALAKRGVSSKHVSSPVAIFLHGGISADKVKVEAEKKSYLLQHYAFYYRGYLRQRQFEQKVSYLRKSRK